MFFATLGVFMVLSSKLEHPTMDAEGYFKFYAYLINMHAEYLRSPLPSYKTAHARNQALSEFELTVMFINPYCPTANKKRPLKEALDIPVWLIPTMPPSVPGIRAQQQLRRSFEALGGVYMLGDTVVKADFKGNRVQAVYSVNHGDISFVAENFVLASGSYFSNGLVARPDSVIEPVFGSDVDFTAGRDSWYDKSFFNKQNYMTFGVATDDKLRIKIKGEVQQNLFAAGSVLSGSNTIHEGCGAGVSMLTALFVADNLIKG